MGDCKDGWDVDGLVGAIDRDISKHHIAATTEGNTLGALLRENPDEGIKMIRIAYERGLDYAYTDRQGHNNRGFIEAVAGGPHEAVPAAVYNAVGSVYPRLTREQKDAALIEVVDGILDRINSFYIQNSHTPYIHEPLLLSDICVARYRYWPGMDEGKHRIGQYPEFSKFQRDLIDENGLLRQDRVNSAFIVAYSLLRNDFCDWGEDYLKSVNPGFLERVLKGIVAMRIGDPPSVRKQTDEEGMARLREILPVSLHDRLESIRQQLDWVDYKKFNPHFRES